MNELIENTKELSLDKIISGAIQIPGVKVDRKNFLITAFSKEDVNFDELIEKGPVAIGVTRETISKIANKIILDRTSKSSLMSFAAGIPGGFAMAATIPADVMQFFGVSLRLAQELSYLYNGSDLWEGGEVDDDKVRNQLILYCGVMFGANGAAAGVRVLSAQMAKNALHKIPQKALTKTFWYPLVKQIGKAVGIKVTKSTVAQGVAKAIPVVGGVISGGLNFASMLPMARRLSETLDEACFGYSDETLKDDLDNIENIEDAIETEAQKDQINIENIKGKMTAGLKSAGNKFSKFISDKKSVHEPVQAPVQSEDVFETIEKLAKLKDIGAITQEEYDTKKSELLSKI